jgi:iron complex outermembrane recepter protein
MNSNTRSQLCHVRAQWQALLPTLLLGLWSSPGFAIAADAPITFAIEEQALATALQQFAQQSDRQILFSTEVVRAKRTLGIKGELEPEAALRVLLQGTGLTFRVTPDQTILVDESGETARVPLSLGSLRLAQAETSATAERAGAEGRPSVEEVIVTAQKREERLRDVAAPVTVVNAQSLVDSNQLRIQDYYTRVPGLNVTSLFPFHQLISIRGITTGNYTNQRVAVLVDDVPFGPSTYLGGGLVYPDFDPGDLNRVEVLRGPQGTLYGASSLGGLIKYVTVDPSMDRFGGKVRAGLTHVADGDDLGYDVRGSANIPLSDTLALLASGFTREDPGYIDNPVLGAEDINKAETVGGRLAAM